MKFKIREHVDNLTNASIADIANVIYRDWRPVNYAAKPYLEAMTAMESIEDNYGMDSGHSIIAYFLSNAGQWKGDVARAVKKELNNRLKRG